MLRMTRYVRVAVVLAACEILILALIFMGLWRLGDGREQNASVAGAGGQSAGCCISVCEIQTFGGGDTTPAACQVDTATVQPERTTRPTKATSQPTPQATPTPGPTETPRPTATVGEPTPTEKPVPSPTPKPEPTATDSPPPTEKPKCNRGLGNGSEGCDPGNSGGNPGSAGEGHE